MADQLWVARYILSRVAEDFGITVTFDPKLFKDFSGAGGHINFSTNTLRAGEGGLKAIEGIMSKLEERHKLHLDVYGDNSLRLSGQFETSSVDKFTYGPGNRSASCRIPTTTYANDGAGYLEDRRPASDINPYVACAAILDTVVLDGTNFGELHEVYMKWQEWKKTAEIEEV